jgi:DNA-directed RNA polymerase subunit beta
MATLAPKNGAGQATENRSTASKRIRKIFRQHPRSFRNAEPHRGSARKLRAVPPLAAAGRLCVRSREDPALVFPIRDFAGTAELDFVNYELEEPKYDVDECRQRGMTYAAPMRVTLA